MQLFKVGPIPSCLWDDWLRIAGPVTLLAQPDRVDYPGVVFQFAQFPDQELLDALGWVVSSLRKQQKPKASRAGLAQRVGLGGATAIARIENGQSNRA